MVQFLISWSRRSMFHVEHSDLHIEHRESLILPASWRRGSQTAVDSDIFWSLRLDFHMEQFVRALEIRRSSKYGSCKAVPVFQPLLTIISQLCELADRDRPSDLVRRRMPQHRPDHHSFNSPHTHCGISIFRLFFGISDSFPRKTSCARDRTRCRAARQGLSRLKTGHSPANHVPSHRSHEPEGRSRQDDDRHQSCGLVRRSRARRRCWSIAIPQSNASSGAGLPARSRAAQHLPGHPGRDAGRSRAASPPRSPTSACIPSHKNLIGANIELVTLDQREYRLRRALEPLRERFQFIVFDCPPALDLLTLNALVAADTVLIPMQAEYFALEGVTELLDTIERIRVELNRGLAIEGVVLTMLDERTNLAQSVAAELRGFFGELMCQTTIPRNIRLAEAPSHGKPALLYDPHARGTEAYRAGGGDHAARRPAAGAITGRGAAGGEGSGHSVTPTLWDIPQCGTFACGAPAPPNRNGRRYRRLPDIRTHGAWLLQNLFCHAADSCLCFASPL